MTGDALNNDSKAIFFYADQEAVLYDELAPLTDGAYELLHEVLTAQFVSWLASATNCDRTSDRVYVLDAGCGTGKEAIALLRADPRIHVLGIDVSRPMLDVFRSQLKSEFGDETAAGRCVLVQSDIRDNDWLDKVMSVGLPPQWPRALDAAISAYTLHHFTPIMKQAIYTSIHHHLRPGGVFVYADLFSFETSWLAAFTQEAEEDYIERRFAAASDTAGQYSITDPAVWERLKKQWVRHVREENHPLAALSAASTDQCLGVQSTDKQLLTKGGFCSVECTFRYGQSGVLWAFGGGDTG